MKKQQIKYLLILVFFIGNGFLVYGQNFSFVPSENNSYLFTPQNLGTSTPQVTDMIRYGNVQVNKYHGLLDFGVALEGYKDRDFDIPISLKYISSGFMPAKRPSAVGYNWVLNCGGVITRTLNGSPDDTKGHASTGDGRDYLLDGMLVAIRENKSTNYSNTDLMNFNVDGKYDLEQDVFTFTFGNYYGRFIISHTGTPILLNENGCKIDISSMPIQSYSTTATPVSSSITITTPDGYVYTFGGESKYLEYFIPNNPEKCKIMPRYITSWLLKSIKAPNNRIANFSYHSKNQLNKYRYIAYSGTGMAIGNGGYGYTSQTTQPLVKDNIYAPILDSISIDNISMRFTYDENIASLYSDESADKSIQLKKIAHYVNNTKLKEADFTYQSKDRYFFLQSVSQKGLKHEFNYNLSTTLPNPTTISVDHWGFWAGGYDTDASDWKTYCENMSTNRTTNPNVCDVGLLNEIIYPTGGKTKITYEYNRYNTSFTRSTTSTSLIQQQSNPVKACGGARVQKVEDFENQTSTTPINSRQFLYQNSSQQEVGIIGTEPKYALTEIMASYQGVGTSIIVVVYIYTDISANSFGSNNLLSEYHVGYPYVKEVFANNSSVKYKFSSWEDVPDSYETGVKKRIELNTNLSMYEIAEKYGTYFTNDMSRFRGRLLEETTYDTSGNIVLQKTNTYNIADAQTKYSISLKSSPRTLGYYKIYQTPCLLTQKNITDKNGVQEQNFYTYNSHNLLSEISLLRSDGKKQKTKFVYPFEIIEGTDTTIMRKMTDKNLISNYIEKVSYLTDGKAIDGEHRKYSEVAANAGIFKPEQIDLLPQNATTTIGNLYPSRNISKSLFLMYAAPPGFTPDYVTENFTIEKYTTNVQLNLNFAQQAGFIPYSPRPLCFIVTISGNNSYRYNLEAVDGQITNNGTYVYQNNIDLNLLPGNYTITLTHASRYDVFKHLQVGFEGSCELSFTEQTPTMAGSYSLLKPEMYYKYDNHGNMIESKPAGSNLPTAYLWGYNCQYPVAKIENATFEQVRTALGSQTAVDGIANADTLSNTQLNTLNNLRNLSNAMVTTYTYKPLIGIETIIDPRSAKVTYHYDDFGRLQWIEDNNGKKIENYNYHYKNQ
ncbi:MAG: hypothetical protein LBO74_01970 [Candidatus Symbiothrix sp.]|jgi:YD repeat-containing protein|nr:hypothetical protein [Candidatus Symbiothrix sp.]